MGTRSEIGADGLVRGHEDVSRKVPLRGPLPRRTPNSAHAKLRSPFADLASPLIDETRGCDDECGLNRPFVEEDTQRGNCLDRLAETHVVSQKHFIL